jgi:hypothetical protein
MLLVIITQLLIKIKTRTITVKAETELLLGSTKSVLIKAKVNIPPKLDVYGVLNSK